MVAVVCLHLVAVFSAEQGLAFSNLDRRYTLALILMNWAIVFAWEIARKIRCQEEETAYVTYSQIFGRPGAVLIAAGAQTVAFAIGLYFAWNLPLSTAFVALWSAAYAVPLGAYARFLLKPTPASAKLGPYAEFYMLAVLGIQALEHMAFS
jgi:hypothetical protein